VDFENFNYGVLQVDPPALLCRALSKGLRDIERGGL
jgi:hypothetical protein